MFSIQSFLSSLVQLNKDLQVKEGEERRFTPGERGRDRERQTDRERETERDSETARRQTVRQTDSETEEFLPPRALPLLRLVPLILRIQHRN